MSNWIEIKDKADVECSMSKKTIDVWIGSDDFGNNYVSIPVEFIDEAITKANNESLVGEQQLWHDIQERERN